MVQLCAVASPLQSHICTFVPLVVDPPLTSTHSAVSSPAMIGPVGVAEPARVTDRLSNWSVWYPDVPRPTMPEAYVTSR